MASRQLKKLQQQHQPELENKSEEDEASPPVTSKPNLFQLLGVSREIGGAHSVKLYPGRCG